MVIHQPRINMGQRREMWNKAIRSRIPQAYLPFWGEVVVTLLQFGQAYREAGIMTQVLR